MTRPVVAGTGGATGADALALGHLLARRLDAPFETAEVHGRDAAARLRAWADERDARILVVGSTHRGALGRAAVGGTAARLLRDAPCAVAIAPRGYAHAPVPALDRIVVGVDGSPQSEQALAAALDLAVPGETVLSLVAAASDPRDRAALVGVLSASAAHVRHVAGIPAGEDLRPGEPAAVLAEESERAGILVIGSRALLPPVARLAHSVSVQLADAARCPVLVMPSGVEAESAALLALEEAARRESALG